MKGHGERSETPEFVLSAQVTRTLTIASRFAERTLAARASRHGVERNAGAPAVGTIEHWDGDDWGYPVVMEIAHGIRRMLTEGTGLNSVSVTDSRGYGVIAVEVDFGPVDVDATPPYQLFPVWLETAADDLAPPEGWAFPADMANRLEENGWNPPHDADGRWWLLIPIVAPLSYKRIGLETLRALAAAGSHPPYKVGVTIEHHTSDEIAGIRAWLPESHEMQALRDGRW